MRAKASVLGHFGEGTQLLNGQTVKTKIITEELQSSMGQAQVLKFDTHGGKIMILKAPFQVFKALKNSTNVLIFPAQNGLRVYAPLISFAKLFYKKRKTHYVVIGGWLPQFISKRQVLTKALKKFDGIYVETNTMKSALEQQGFSNVFVMPNCKKLRVLSAAELVYPSKTPYKLCTFSRVMQEKGIETAVNAVKQVNDKLGYMAYTLDIYGQVDSSQTEWFESLKNQFPDYICYCGCVDADKSVQILQRYFALLFPTHFYTEGIPGTIIDAYAAGIPVISAKWASYTDVVDDGVTGIGYDFDNTQQFVNILLDLIKSPAAFLDMKTNCIRKAKDYTPETAIKILTEKFDGE
ncbi:MAG: glycosyltransferase [Clostridia bacterium]|nr:glycosyltransferase [Clostridia bacterium]